MRKLAAASFVTFLAAAVTVVFPTTAAAVTPPPPETFQKSNVSVVPGSSLSLHWHPVTFGQFYLLSSPGPNSLPNFSSSSVVTWPTDPGGTWHGDRDSWVSLANAVSVAIPSNAIPGTTYTLRLVTCTLAACSADLGGDGASHVTITVARNWAAVPYSSDFRTVRTTSQQHGSPLDVVFAGSTIWNSSEFRDALGRSVPGGSKVDSIVVPYDVQHKPFAACTGVPKCGSTSHSALGERVIYHDGQVWFTQGGSAGAPTVPNHSVVNAYDPRTQRFCTYLVPGNNNQVHGIAATGTNASTVIWFVESDAAGGHPALDSLSASRVGNSCRHDHSLAGAPSFRRISLPSAPAAYPAMVTPDPDGQNLWVSAMLAGTILKVNGATGSITSYTYPSRNAYSFVGLAMPWQVAVDTTYVYAIDFGDDALIRINKSSGHIDQVPIPRTSDTENGYGLALAGGKLYFTMSDPFFISHSGPRPAFGAASTFGYVDVSGWGPSQPAPPKAVVYTGLDSRVDDPSRPANFRGIAHRANGELAIADKRQVVRLYPLSRTRFDGDLACCLRAFGWATGT